MSGGVYFIRSATFDLVKIGYAKDVERRFLEIQQYIPESLELLFIVRTGSFVCVEKLFHKRFADKRRRYEWFQLSVPEIEQFLRDWSIETEIVHDIQDVRGISRAARLDMARRRTEVECLSK